MRSNVWLVLLEIPYFAEFLSYLLVNDPEAYERRMTIFNHVVIIPTENALTYDEKITLIQETNFQTSGSGQAFNLVLGLFN